VGVSKPSERWHKLDLGCAELNLLNLEHPDIHQRVIAEIDEGVDVYYDERWKATEHFGRLLYSRRDLVEGKSVLILGAGVGLEQMSGQLWYCCESQGSTVVPP
jgi:predicted nicotinamide N-methyase